MGSPPHTWGIQSPGLFILLQSRITPTYMGNTCDDAVLAHKVEDHPHIHGEYFNWSSVNCSIIGSPPHTWGILNNIILGRFMHGITPTYMGNTGDDPYTVNYLEGSPPHTWGIPNAFKDRHCDLRITPTYMGNTLIKRLIDCLPGDHPHIHGEYLVRAIIN